MSNLNGQQIIVELDVQGLDEYQQTKNVNDFFRTAIREFGATYGVDNYEIKEHSHGCICIRKRYKKQNEQ